MLQDKVKGEMKKLINRGQIKMQHDCSDIYFVSPIVITIEKDGLVKLGFEARKLNKHVNKEKNQKLNIEEIMDRTGQTISERKNDDVIFELQIYHIANVQLALNPETSI